MAPVSKPPRFTKEEETALHARMVAGDTEAKEELARYCLTLAERQIRRHSYSGVPVDELESLFHFAVSRALRDFDPERSRLATFVAMCMWSVVKDYQRNHGSLIHLPRGNCRDALNPEELERLRHIRSTDLKYENSEGVGQSIIDVVSDEEPVHSRMEREEDLDAMRVRYHDAMETLPERDAAMLRLRHEGKTQKVIGEQLGLSESRISQAMPAVVLPATKSRILAIEAAIYQQECVLQTLRDVLTWLKGDAKPNGTAQKLPRPEPIKCDDVATAIKKRKRKGRPAGLTVGSHLWKVIEHLKEFELTSAEMVAKALGVSKLTAAGILTKGKQRGYLAKAGYMRWKLAEPKPEDSPC